ncbi:MAG: sigma-54 dependent transcriptional regulator [Bacteroidota bacterium]
MLLKNTRILIVDDDVDVLTALRLLLKAKVKEVITEANPNNLNAILTKRKVDVVILDMNFNSVVNTGNEGVFWLNKIKRIDANIAVILITAYGDIELAIKSLKTGAADFLVKPWKNDKLIQSISEVIKSKRSSGTGKSVPQHNTPTLLGRSKIMQHTFLKIKKIAPTEANVLILGENGTGKDLIARAIHDNSLRKNEKYIKVDLGSLNPSLFEGELFGHKKGAYTDAKEDRKGRFEIANKGTLFLDEIGNISLQQQASLLNVIQNRCVTPLGSNMPIPINIRLICATNLSLEQLADENRFRKDLIYRINTIEVIVPPLRDRRKDILLLANHFLSQYSEKYFKSGLSMNEGFIKKLNTYHFPGNVRELQYIIERAVIMSETGTLNENDFVFSPIEADSNQKTLHNQTLDFIEKSTIKNVLEKNYGNISKSAKELGITRSALYRRLQKYGL